MLTIFAIRTQMEVPRIHVLIARDAPVGVIIRHGLSKSVGPAQRHPSSRPMLRGRMRESTEVERDLEDEHQLVPRREKRFDFPIGSGPMSITSATPTVGRHSGKAHEKSPTPVSVEQAGILCLENASLAQTKQRARKT